MRTKITDLASLQTEKKRLKLLCAEAEKNLAADFNYLRENYSEMTVDFVLPFEKNTNRTTARVLDLLNSKFVDSALGIPQGNDKTRTLEQVGMRLLQMLVVRFGANYIKNFFRKK